MKEVQLYTTTIRQLPITNKRQRLEPLERPGVPEPAQMFGDIVVPVVYSTVASTQWSNRQIR